MKRILAMLALGAALALPIPVVAAGNDNNATDDILLEGEFTNDGRPEISGTLFNTSDKTSYDDVVICVDFYDQSHNIIKSENYTIKQDVEQGENEDFTLKLNAPEGMFTADYDILSADLD